MKFQFVFGFMLLILFFVAMFVGLPYLLQIIKSNQFFNLPRFISTSTPGYFYSKSQPLISRSQFQSQPVIKSGESIYKGRISISSVYRSSPEQINLSAANFGGSLDITGWKIRSARRGETLIGRGVNIPQFSAGSSDIWLIGGESVQIIAGVSPLVNNFRVNNCFGGLSNLYNLNFGNYCPALKVDNLFSFDGSCQDLILRSSSCLAPSDNILNKQSAQCRIWFEKNVNYNACVAQHQNDRDFYKEWRIYTGNTNQIFDQLHDRIELRDQAGLLVDSYEY